MDEEKKCTCTDDCDCGCNSVDCGCCEKKEINAGDADPEAEPADDPEIAA